MDSCKIINVESWKRKQHFEIFRQYQNPRYDISFEVDITNFYEKIKRKELSFTLAFMYAVMMAANEIEEFRYRFEKGEVVLYHKLNASFTYLNQDTELMKNVVAEYKDTMDEFVQNAKKIADKQEEYFTGPLGNNIYQFSSLPWISYTHISHTNSGKKDNAIPIFVWGKYFYRNHKLLLPFSVEVHHSFVDGIHLAKLQQKLQEYLDNVQ